MAASVDNSLPYLSTVWGIEKMPEYLEIANKRIHQLEASQSMNLFDGMEH